MTDTAKQPTCAELIDGRLESVANTLRDLWALHCEDSDAYHDDHGTNMYEYGLSFDYVEGGTEYNPENGYFRYQLSWGGPSDEFRFYADADKRCHYVEYAYLDWFDGATRELTGDDKTLLLEIFDEFFGEGVCEHVFNEATAA